MLPNAYGGKRAQVRFPFTLDHPDFKGCGNGRFGAGDVRN